MNLSSRPLFSAEYSEGLVHQVVTAYLAGGRQGTKAQKTRSEVCGGGAKPWKQKGTGRARAGTIRSPIWRTGGVTFAAKPRNFKQKVNRKMYRKAISVILSELLRTDRLVVVDSFALEAPKTKQALAELEKHKAGNNVLILTKEFDKNIALAVRNLYRIDYGDFESMNPVSLVAYEKVLVTADFISKVEEVYGE